VTASRRGVPVLLSLAVCATTLSGCGKKGPPLPPLARVPATPANLQAARFGDDVYVWFTVPTTNVGGQSPADLSAIDLYAVTAVRPPGGVDMEDQAIKVASYPVRPPAPPSPALALPPGFVQGASAVVLEALSEDKRRAEVVPGLAAAVEESADEVEPLLGPLVPPADAQTLKRHYFLVAVGPRARESAPTAVVSVPVADPSDPPTGLRLEYTESAMALSWQPSATARIGPAPSDPALVPAKPLVAQPPATGYHVFEAPTDAGSVPDPYALTLPAALTPQPVGAAEFAIPGPVRFGVRRCFVVRPVDVVTGQSVTGRASEPACVTPVDTFPPAPPTQLAAIAGVGVINLIWQLNTEPDLAGYIVLRGEAPNGPLAPLTPAPIQETTYRDQSVAAGVRYIYAVVAVDSAAPPNVSGQSNRVEEGSRTPRR